MDRQKLYKYMKDQHSIELADTDLNEIRDIVTEKTSKKILNRQIRHIDKSPIQAEEKVIKYVTVTKFCPECSGTGESYQKSYHNQLELKTCQTCQGAKEVITTKAIDITDIFNNLVYKNSRDTTQINSAKHRHTNAAAHQYATNRKPLNQREYMMLATAYFDGMQKI